MDYEKCSNCEKFVSDLDWKDKEIEKFKAEIQRLKNASYSLVISMFHSGKYDEYTGKEFREMLSNCGFIEDDLVFTKHTGALKKMLCVEAEKEPR